MLRKLTAPQLWLALFALLLSSVAMAQRNVSGRIVADEKPVAGITVTARGTNVSTQTDNDGNFTLSVPQGATHLVITSVGYEAQELAIPASGNVNIAMRANAAAMNEVVVTTGYVAQRKREITGSVAVVPVAQLRQQPTGTFQEALQGKAAGVTIITSGQPGAGADIRIRGITGFGNNQPLVIVDGVRGNLQDINPNDVESVQVLKDAAAAIYGVAGSNGVIIVTTKRGRSGRARVTYDAYYGITTRGRGYDIANPTEHANAIWQQMRNSGLTPDSAQWGNRQYGIGATPVIPDYITPSYDRANLPPGFSPGGYVLCNCPRDAVVDPALYNRENYQITRANREGTNWYNEITRNAPMQSHNLAVSAGSDKSSYYFSMNYLEQQGIARFQYLKRYAVRANTQFSVTDNIRVGQNAYIFYRQNPRFGNQGEGSPFSMALRQDPLIPVYDIMGNFAGTKSQGLGNARNPYADIYRTKDNRGHQWDINGNIFAEVDFLRNFTARSSFGGVINNGYYYNFNYVGYENAEGNTGTNSFGEGASYNSQWTWNNTLAYNKTFGDHNVRALIGTEAVVYKGRGLSAGRSNYFSENPNFWTLSAGAANQSNSGYAYHNATWSQFGRIDYAFRGKYLFNGNLRRDGFSSFIDEARYNWFPSASVAWRISQEDFMREATFVNDLKLRYSWGKLGNAGNTPGTNPYNLYASRPGFSAYDISGTSNSTVAGFYASNVGNPLTTFEANIITNVGIDATILRNKLDFSIDWYKKAVSGLLFTAADPSTTVVFVGGAGLPLVNIGDMQNTGIDANITYHGSVARDFKFDITGTFTSYKNRIVDIPGVNYFEAGQLRNQTVTRNQVGRSVGEFFGYKVLGLFQSDDEVTRSPTQSGAQPGVFKYADIDGNGVIDQNDRTFIGNPNPDFTYGLNLAASYKAFDFSAFFFGSYGNDIFNQTQVYTDFPNFFKGAIRREVALNAWTPQNPNTNIPLLLNTGSFSTDAVTNSYFVSSGSYFRNKQMQIGYTLPNTLLSRFGIERFRIYVQSANLFTFTKYKGLDPELSSPDANARTPLFGIDQGNYPHTPSFLFGVNVNF